MDKIIDYADAVAVAAQIGRLDVVSILLAVVTVVLAIIGLGSFIQFRRVIKKEAEKEATKVAKEVAERTAREYVEKEWKKLTKPIRI